MKQTVGRDRVTPLRGILMIAAIFVSFFLVTAALALLEMMTGFLYGKFVLWGLGALAALYLMFFYVRRFEYELDGFDLKVSRSYGNRARPMVTCITRNMRYVGEPEEAKKRYPGAREYRAVHKSCPHPRLSIAYDTDGTTRILTLQPEPALREAILRAMKEEGRGK